MKEYRQSSHAFPLAFWAVLCTAAAIVLFVHSHRIVSRVLRTEEVLGGVALLIFGPAALAVYLIRARQVWVSVDPGRGILVSGRRTISWEEIRRVDRKRPSFRDSTGPAQAKSFGPGDLGGGCIDPGCGEIFGEGIVLILIVLAALVALWLLWAVVLPLLVIPLLEVFAPFGDRISIVTRRGTLVLRDLRDADAFLAEVRPHLPRP